MARKKLALPKKQPTSASELDTRFFIVRVSQSHLHKGSSSAPHSHSGRGGYQQDMYAAAAPALT